MNDSNINNLDQTKKVRFFRIVFSILVVLGFTIFIFVKKNYNLFPEDRKFKILSSTANKAFNKDLIDYGQENNINITIDYYGDLEIVKMLNQENDYDAVWISNSIWLYMLDNSYLVTDSKSIGINPVIMGIKKSKAQELGFVEKEIYNKDILETIKKGELKYIMSSVTQTNTGASAYLGFLNSLAGSPEVLTSDMLKDESLIEKLKDFFQGIERVSGDDNYLTEIFLNGNYEAMINYESLLIDLNKKLEAENKEPLYLLYPVDGVALNDMPFGYIEHNQNKKETFEKIQKYLLSSKVKEKLEKNGIRTWYGGINNEATPTIFNKNWGINTDEYLIPLKYPSKAVISEAMDIYIEKLRKANHTFFCLDYSGSMHGDGIQELKEAMHYILNYEEAKKDYLQFSDKDKVTVIGFDESFIFTSETYQGENIKKLIEVIDSYSPNGGTNIYDPTREALETLSKDDPEIYTRTVILMTDGESNSGNFETVSDYYSLNNLDIPVYSITFGKSNDAQLLQIANLTNAKIFDGKSGLKKAFSEVRGYN